MSVAALLDRAAETKAGFISGVASTPATDSYGHRVMPRAFEQSVRRKGLAGPSGVKLLHNHTGNPIGRITRLETIRDELRIAAELNLDIPSVRELHSAIPSQRRPQFLGRLHARNVRIHRSARSRRRVDENSGRDLMEVSVAAFLLNLRLFWTSRSRARFRRRTRRRSPTGMRSPRRRVSISSECGSSSTSFAARCARRKSVSAYRGSTGRVFGSATRRPVGTFEGA
jgi:hypothetical protein